MPDDLLNVTIEDGKYTIIQRAGGRVEALRYGETWQDLTGNKLVLCLAQEVQALREQVARQQRKLDLCDDDRSLGGAMAFGGGD